MKTKLKPRKNPSSQLYRLCFILSFLFISISVPVVFTSSTSNKSWAFNWAGIRPEVRDSILLFERRGTIHIGLTGYAAKESKQYLLYLWLRRNTTQKEMLQLLNYPSPCVKAVFYASLIRRKNNLSKKNLLMNALNDTTDTFYFFPGGCEGTAVFIGEYLIEYTLGYDARSPLGNSYFFENIKILNLSTKDVELVLEKYNALKIKYPVFYF